MAPTPNFAKYKGALAMQKEQLEPAAAIEPKQKTMEERVAIGLAVSQYVRAAANLEHANVVFREACQSFRAITTDVPDHFITKVDFQLYLVWVNDVGDFKIEKIETI